MAFREAFKLASKQSIRWFPGHMCKGLRIMQQKLKLVDCIIEVHDARIPFSGRNPEFHNTITGGGLKPHILVLNKADLADKQEKRRITERLKQLNGISNVLFTNCKDQQSPALKKILTRATELIASSERYNRTGEKAYNVMIIGVPNVGKSSLLNVLRNRHLKKKGASDVGNEAGVTRSVLERIKICEDPLTYMIDTPGILEPAIKDDEMGMKLAAVGCLPDHLVGEEVIADYLLYWLNRNNRFEYMDFLGLQSATDDVAVALVSYANKLNVQRKAKKFDGSIVIMPDIKLAARYFIKHFRKGGLGGVNLDADM